MSPLESALIKHRIPIDRPPRFISDEQTASLMDEKIIVCPAASAFADDKHNLEHVVGPKDA